MTMQLSVLQCGSCEPLKAGVHGTALGLFAVMGLYNAAAWLARREQHLAVNAILYGALTAWEQQQVTRHRCAVQRARNASAPPPEGQDLPPAVSDLVAA